MYSVAVLRFLASLDIQAVLDSLECVQLKPCVIDSSYSELPPGIDAVVLPGGFSYADYLRPGALAATEPIIASIIDRARNGLPVLGICNGFQICCEAGLLPGTLLRNTSNEFICDRVSLKISDKSSIWTAAIYKKKLNLILKSSYGRYYIDSTSLRAMLDRQQIVFRYRENINGSTDSIAGIRNVDGNVMGVMPHPEYGSRLKFNDGISIFRSLKSYMASA